VPGAPPRAAGSKREADLLPVGYFHVVFTLPAEVAAIAYYNKALVYDLLFKAAADTMLTIAADPKHLGARIGITAVLHTWGSALTHHPHIHMIVPGGGISRDGTRWISARPAFLLPVRVLGALFRRLFLTRLRALHDAGKLAFGSLTHLAERRAFLRHLSPVRKKRWVVYAKPPFAGPRPCSLTSRATPTASPYRTAGSSGSTRPGSPSATRITARPARTAAGHDLAADEFIRRFLLHALPRGFHRIRHYGLLASARRKDHLERARRLLSVAPAQADDPPAKIEAGRCARAAAAPWSSSRCSNAPISPGRRRPQCSHPGYRRRDPARPDADTIQGRPAPGGRPARAGTAQKQTPEQHNRSVRFSASAFTTHIQTVRYRARPLLGNNWLPRHQRKTTFPIAQSMRPAVRAPKTF
jgi:hypothetical protein